MERQLHIISTGKQPLDQFVAICARVHPYVDAIHVREKMKTAREISEFLTALIKQGVPPRKIIVNDRIDVAVVFGVKGVQLAHHSLSVRKVKHHFPSLSIGCSVHSIAEAMEAEESGADYCIYGHVFATGSKVGVPPRGIESLRSVVNHVNIPVIAIGGIHSNNAEQVLKAGAQGIAVMSAVFFADDPVSEAKKLAKIVKKMV
ncbi:thiazole tautomerase TenI [Parageobacillus toebii NBRC 107807]|jgi:thiazole tautomerase (transcriptional regulator TenI)|uniref:Thiazole tautomerase (Transcriptional regulator TenI) n=1 Tax=Parageobacillus toebii NBRC 107807 TaxID=1223503 RepID=A0A6G9J1S5_9BACL|nr:thiazole tautomerase TenI [Parageobacillus toebii]OQP01965.1 thiamine phosphate synthase [Geobacillus sp. 44C]MBB3868395.1 thiazole tautomerase (transcriptional regulator TenI) [Parageobacillus toebii NBRC 107807]MED4990284.1 thiazole tautomerase TenI [Parageobacillus toebii]QIQ32673.1 thiazole tautomerase TenI [Parageobacillus toebii NBRC 107807]QNU33577.1 thiazole tautomerase TenI [Geobacillus sp. 44C]